MSGIIIGAGIGGLTAAIGLRHEGILTSVYEAAPQLRPIGAGILIPPNAMKVLEVYQLDGDIKKRGAAIDSFVVLDGAGKRLSTMPACFQDGERRIETIAIARGALQNVLMQAVGETNILTGKRCIHLNASADSTEVKFDDQSTVQAEFVVGADGIHSTIRSCLFPGCTPRSVGRLCHRGVVKFTLPEEYIGQLTEIWGYGKQFGFVRIDESNVYWYSTCACTHIGSSIGQATKAALLNIHATGPKIVRELIESTEGGLIIEDELRELPTMRSWSTHGVILMGDAAHASTPNLGQGGAMAIEDAWTLSQQIRSAASYAEAFKQFKRKRHTRVNRIVRLSRWLGGSAAIENRAVCKIRNRFIGATPRYISELQSRMLYGFSVSL